MLHYLSDYLHILFHLDHYLPLVFAAFGVWTYVILFGIIFCESGLIITPFLPGESLLFALGILATTGAIHLHILVVVLIIAAILGGMLNFLLGYKIGHKIFPTQRYPRFNRYFASTQQFYLRHGGKTILLARVVPIVRTYAPFVAGVARMNTFLFLFYNAIGGVLWIVGFVYISYYFGTIPFVRQHFSWFILAIVIISVLPVLYPLCLKRR